MLDSEDAAGIESEQVWLALRDERTDLLAHQLGIGKEQSALRAQDQQIVRGFVSGMLGGKRAQGAGTRFSTDDMDFRIGRLARQARGEAPSLSTMREA